MVLRAPGSDLPEFPQWLHRCVEEDWADPADDTHYLTEWESIDRVRAILRHGRWSDARRAWAAEHGVEMRDLPRSWGRR